MKIKLLLSIFLLLGLKAFAQAEAYPVPNIYQCGNEVFDLTANTPIALGNQDPLNFTVTYFEFLPDAQNNVNAIANPGAYIPEFGMHSVFVRVSNNATGEYDIADFYVSWQSTVLPFSDQVSCGNFALWGIESYWSYYTGPGGTGTQLFEGDIISQTTTLYVYQTEPCVAEGQFTITILPEFVANEPTPLLVCAENSGFATVDLTSKAAEIIGNLPNATIQFFISNENAEGGFNTIPNPGAYTSSMALPYVIYVRVENSAGCFDIVTLTVEDGGCTDNSLSGSVVYDMNGDGCDSADGGVEGIPVIYAIGGTNNIITTYTNSNGEFSFYNLPDGAGSVSVSQNNFYTISPSSRQFTFPATSAEPADFCLTVPNPVNDVAVTLVPMSGAQPGFQAFYSIFYENNGALPASGTITLQFDTNHLAYASSSPGMAVSENTITLAYSNLQPFQSASATVIFDVNLPQVTPGGTLLNFVTTIDPVTGDANPSDNSYQLGQYVVNSWDPNDITVHEGEFITEQQADGFLHYTIRFQNEGDANAVNVSVDSPIDSNLDVSTLELVGSSHDYTATIANGIATFNFNGINLTWADDDEMASQGFVSYRIKPVSSVAIGDEMLGGIAGIFFDFNDPVMTNTVTTTIQALNTKSFAASDFIMYPNPASDYVTLQMKDISGKVNVSVTDILGKIVISANDDANNSAVQINTTSLNAGMYFVTVTAGNKTTTQKLFVK